MTALYWQLPVLPFIDDRYFSLFLDQADKKAPIQNPRNEESASLLHHR